MNFQRSKHLSNEQLSLLIDGRLSEKERERVEAHLRACATCRDAYEGLRQTVALLRATPRVAVPRAFTLSEADVGRAPARSSATWTRWATALVGLVLVLVIGLDVATGMFAPAAPAPAERVAKVMVVTKEVQAVRPHETPVIMKGAPAEEKEPGLMPAARASIPTTSTLEVTAEALALPAITPAAMPPTPTPAPAAPQERGLLPTFAPRWGLRVAEIGLALLFLGLLVRLKKGTGT